MNPESDQNDRHDLEEQHPTLAPAQSAGAAASAAAEQPDTGLAEHDVRARTGEPQLVAGSTQTPVAATRFVETSVGRLSYTQLAERLAPTLQAVDLRIRSGEFVDRPLDEALLLLLHAQLSDELFPEDAGHYRRKEVRVGSHEPPVPPLVPQRMREYILDLDARMQNLSAGPDDLLLEFLAYAEGMLLSIHPFPDLNGRISRLWLTEILQRLKLPPVDVVPVVPTFRDRYLTALAAADRRDWKPLMALWKERLSQEQGINEIVLRGCTPTPLASYLKALAVLRLVAEAPVEDGGDPEATGFWRNEVFVVRTKLNASDLRQFFLEHYCPTPVISPWNGRAGFLEGEDGEISERKGAVVVRTTLNTKGKRFVTYRRVLNRIAEVPVIRELNLVRAEVKDLESKKKKKVSYEDGVLKEKKALEGKLKAELLTNLRAVLDEEFLEWLDACVVLSERTIATPLLGSGGNEGSMDFSVNHLIALLELIDADRDAPKSGASEAIEDALDGTSIVVTTTANPGFLSPFRVGGVNMTTGFSGGVGENAWNTVLMIEGALLFAATTTRKLDSASPAALSFPFVVEPVRAGHGGMEYAESARPEFWAPLWRKPVTVTELRALLAEGRSTIGSRRARTGLDMARAAASLGVDRGLSAFQRFGFFERRGKGYYVAAALSRFAVQRNSQADSIDDLDRANWLNAVQRYARDEDSPNAFRVAVYLLDSALFALTQEPRRETFQAVLQHIGRIEAILSISTKAHEAIQMPVPRLSLSWAINAQDSSSAEFSIATALAGLHMRSAGGHFVLHARRHLAAVSEVTSMSGDRNWEPTSRVVTWGTGSLTNNLAALLHRRRLEAELAGTAGELLASATGATCADVLAFLDGETDDTHISELLSGLACVDLTDFPLTNAHEAAVLPPAFALLKVFFTSEAMLRTLKWLPPDRTLPLPAEIPARLSSGNVEAAVRIAWQRLRALGVKLPGRDPPHIVATDKDGPRWLAALCIPLTLGETRRLLRALDLTPETTPESLPESLAL